MNIDIRESVTQKLIKYCKISSASDLATTHPSTPSHPREWEIANVLKSDLESIGASNVVLTEGCYVFGEIPANIPSWEGPVIGFIAHMDVSCEVPFENVKPQIIHYEGGDLVINRNLGVILTPEKEPVLNKVVGMDLICSDGTTLLGADNKCAIAYLLTMAEILIGDDTIKHGTIKFAFTPDEEIGRSGVFLDLDQFGVDFAYTIDSQNFGELITQTFNAYSADVRIHGQSSHPGEAKGRMVNAINAATEFHAMLPEAELAEHSEGMEGFYHCYTFQGDVLNAHLQYYVRDFDYENILHRCDVMQAAANYINAKYGEGTLDLVLTEGYHNMHELVSQHPALINIPVQSMRELGIEPEFGVARGGTDGSMLSSRGLPCPNIGTGEYSVHSFTEFAVIQHMEMAVQLIIKIVQRFGTLKKDEV